MDNVESASNSLVRKLSKVRGGVSEGREKGEGMRDEERGGEVKIENCEGVHGIYVGVREVCSRP